MTHRSPFQPLPFCDSVILFLLISTTKILATKRLVGDIKRQHFILSYFTACSDRKNIRFLFRESGNFLYVQTVFN